MDMASAEELGLVWMGDMLLHNDTGGLMINSNVEPHRTFFPEATQAMESMRPTEPRMYLHDMNGFMVLDDMEETSNYYDEDSSSQTMDVASELGVNQTAGGENSGQGGQSAR